MLFIEAILILLEILTAGLDFKLKTSNIFFYGLESVKFFLIISLKWLMTVE